MNIPQDTLQQVADAAFKALNIIYLASDPINGECQADCRRAIIQHALDNPALLPFLAGVGEYTDTELLEASNKVDRMRFTGFDWLRAFLAALPRRESPALADLKSDLDGWKDRAVSLEGQVNEALARAEKAEAELAKSREINQGLTNSCLGWEKIVQELKSAQLGILRPIAEMPETVPEGVKRIYAFFDSGEWTWMQRMKSLCTDFADILLPAEPTPQAQAEPAAQVPLGPEDVPPGSVFTFGAAAVWITPLCVSSDGVGFPDTEPNKPLIQRFSFDLLQEAAKINTSLPDTGRWDANAWRPCRKPGKEVAK